jgi:hypothetical protein
MKVNSARRPNPSICLPYFRAQTSSSSPLTPAPRATHLRQYYGLSHTSECDKDLKRSSEQTIVAV